MENVSIKLDEKSASVLNLIKLRYGLNSNSQAIEFIINNFADEEPELRGDFIKKIKEIEKQKSIIVDDFSKRYGLD